MPFPRARTWAVAVLTLALAASRAPAQTAEDFFDDRLLHEIRLDMHPNDWLTLKTRFEDNTSYPCEMRWKFQGREILVQNIYVRSRGTGSRSPVKPGLRVDFDRFEGGKQDFLGLKSVILRNNTQDASIMRERLSMPFFQRMGLVTSREAHTRLYVNDQYVGLYTIVETVDKRMLKRVFGENDGYLYKYDFAAGDPQYRFQYRGSDPALYSPKPFLPETRTDKPNPAPLEAMIRTMNQASDADFPGAIEEFLNLKLFLAYVATENFLAEQDGFLGLYGMNNYYLYRFEKKNLHQLIAWDKSHTLEAVDYLLFQNANDNVLMRRALQAPGGRQTYLEMLAKMAMLASGTGGWLEQEIARQYNQTRTAALEDPNKQCLNEQGLQRSCSNEEFEAAIVFLTEFARRRRDSVLGQLADEGFQLPAGGPAVNPGGAINAASNLGAVLAPGSLVSVYGAGLAGTTAQATSLPLPTTLEGVSFYINGFPAPLLFVSPGQVNLQVPWEVQPGSAPLTGLVNAAPSLVNGVIGNTISLNIGPYSPGVFLAVHGDASLVTEQKPAVAGEVLVVYSTGLGPVTVNVATGQAAPADPLARTTQAPGVTMGGVPAVVEFSGLTPGFAGLYQVNVRVPANVPAGSRTPLVVSIGGQNAPPVFLATR